MKKLIKNHTELKINHCLSELKELISAKEKRLGLSYGLEDVYRKTLMTIPNITPSVVDFSSDWIKIGKRDDLTEEEYKILYSILRSFSPWRKGPFELFGIKVDTEWASYIKWNRLINKIAPLKGRRVLDIGCSSGYYMFKMLEHDPAMILGIDPQLLFYYQYKTLQHYIKSPNLYYIPAMLEELPVFKNYFDTVLCMGIIYHRKSPIDTLADIHKNMKKNGELIIETLIMEGESDMALFPVDRYAKMKNVFFIPTVKCLESWLQRARFKNIKCIDISKTTLDEQRKTDWINTESLEDFIDPNDPSKTVEGYQAPVRAIVTANAG
jgi:tRNA (mo5U34)-methyltransferase